LEPFLRIARRATTEKGETHAGVDFQGSIINGVDEVNFINASFCENTKKDK
jgi:hypothetical protein